MIIKDCIYRYIQVPELCRTFMNTPEFQRLRRIRQLGVAHYVYPSATHTRLEHSLGVMHLAGKAVDALAPQIAERDKHLVMLAGLFHDVGHHAFSHMFDTVAPRAGLTHSIRDHEQRSVKIFLYLNERLHWPCDRDEVTFVTRAILGLVKKPAWMYQIVHNRLCGVDVDRMDYLQRDAYHTGMPGFQPDFIITQMVIGPGGNLAFHEKARADIQHIFETRTRMFTTVYHHPTVLKINALYERLMLTSMANLPEDQILEEFEDDFLAEVHLRRTYPDCFAMIDAREFGEPVAVPEITNGNQMQKVVFVP